MFLRSARTLLWVASLEAFMSHYRVHLHIKVLEMVPWLCIGLKVSEVLFGTWTSFSQEIIYHEVSSSKQFCWEIIMTYSWYLGIIVSDSIGSFVTTSRITKDKT